MVKESDWSDAEFDTLLSNPELSSKDLVSWLPKRSIISINRIRSRIHAFHTGKEDHLLSNMMVRFIQNRSRHHPVTCPVCKVRF